MQEFINALIARLEERKKIILSHKIVDAEDEAMVLTYNESINIVNQLAEEYNNGWILCEERLPDSISTVLVQVKEIKRPTFGWFGNMYGWRLVEQDFVDLKDFTVLAWQPLPPKYEPKGE